VKVQFVGVGEAFDETLSNNSQILEWDNTRLLIDCGYSVPHALWKMHPEPEYLDAIYISHRHADHYFGLPSYLVRLAEDGRKRDIEIICSQELKTVILEMIDYAYLGVLSHLGFSLIFHEVSPANPFPYRGAWMEFAVSSHPVMNLSIAIKMHEKKYAYSGDGNFNENTARLYQNCTFLVHEAYSITDPARGHATIANLLEMAKQRKVERLALTHIQRNLRRERMSEIQRLIQLSGVSAFVAQSGEIYDI
jgi:ribonuclease BN (tRNA processing enzyme)